MDTFNLSVGGELRSASETFGVDNPATGAIFAACPSASRSDLDEAVERAQASYKAWARDLPARRRALARAGERLGENRERLARLVTLEQGKTFSHALEEVDAAAAWFTYFADHDFAERTLTLDGFPDVTVYRRPIGVVGAITPWNYPMTLATWKLAPALLAGNAVVLKPSPYTPLSSLEMGRLLADVFPKGVLSVISGGNELGAWMTSHNGINRVSFTGSVATGKRVLQSASEDLKRVSLELGGNDPAIILSDADIRDVTPKIFDTAFRNCGQVCIAVKRVYAHESIYPALVAELAEIAAKTIVGSGLDQKTELGPLTNQMQWEKVRSVVDAAQASGAKQHQGCQDLANEGYFLRPTIFSDIDPDHDLVLEEQFGPVLPVVPFSNEADAIRMANGTRFGLGASVWSSSEERASELAREVEAGVVWINHHLNVLPHAPFGGFKWSGMGRENGEWGLNSFTEVQAVYRAA